MTYETTECLNNNVIIHIILIIRKIIYMRLLLKYKRFLKNITFFVHIIME